MQIPLRSIYTGYLHRSACKKKLLKCEKFGQGEVLRHHKSRITSTRMFETQKEGNKVKCLCGKEIGIDKGTYFKMIGKAFTYSGTKVNK